MAKSESHFPPLQDNKRNDDQRDDPTHISFCEKAYHTYAYFSARLLGWLENVGNQPPYNCLWKLQRFRCPVQNGQIGEMSSMHALAALSTPAAVIYCLQRR
jgi:hypothetical protein